MFKNKHVTTAFIVAPILAILSYFATDYIVSDLPSAAEDGTSYSLLARPNCRYQSGQCTLVNGDLEIRMHLLKLESGETVLQANTSHPLKGVRVALVNTAQVNQETPPLAFVKVDEEGTSWRLPMTPAHLESHEIRIATLADKTIFYGSTETTFFTYQTGFAQDKWL